MKKRRQKSSMLVRLRTRTEHEEEERVPGEETLGQGLRQLLSPTRTNEETASSKRSATEACQKGYDSDDDDDAAGNESLDDWEERDLALALTAAIDTLDDTGG